jgi:acyl-CoA thioesterase I
MKMVRFIALQIFVILAFMTVAAAQSAPQDVKPDMTDEERECSDLGLKVGDQTTPQNLPNLAKALKDRRKVKILTIGSSTSGGRAPKQDYSNLIQTYLYSAFKDLEVEINDRGVSGELSERAAERIQLEVSLNQPDLILWQIGTFDAMSQVDPAKLEKTLISTAKWLRSRNVDLVIVGMHYLRSLSTNDRYQNMRKVIQDVTKREGILRIGRYEAVEMIERALFTINKPTDEFQLTENGYNCMSHIVARALATSLFPRDAPRKNN